MKKLLLIFALMFAVLTVKAQLPPLPSSNFKLISPYSFKYYTPYNSKVKSVWMNMGLTYGWMELLGYHRADSLFQQYRRLNDHDSLSTLQEKSYNSLTDKPNFGLYRLLTNHDSLSTLDEKSYNSLTDKPTIPDVSIYRRLNNHDSLNTLQEKSYNSLNDKPNLAIYRRNNDHDSLSTLQEKAYSSLTGKPTLGTASAQDVGYFATAAQANATHTGDVTGATALTIGAGKVTLAMQSNMATASLIYRKTAGVGAPEVNSLATLKTDLGLTGTNSGDQNAAGVSIADAGGIITGTNVETALQENRTAINLNTAKVTNATHSGDATGATALTLATVNANVGTYNNITINGKGLATAGSNVAYVTGTPWTAEGYLLATGATTGATSQAQTFTNGIISNSTVTINDIGIGGLRMVTNIANVGAGLTARNVANESIIQFGNNLHSGYTGPIDQSKAGVMIRLDTRNGTGSTTYGGQSYTLFQIQTRAAGVVDGTHTIPFQLQAAPTGSFIMNTLGNVGHGILPTAVIHPKAGTATVNTAPLKLTQTSAVVLTTPEAGAIECNDGDLLYYTIKTGPTRKTIAFTSDIVSQVENDIVDGHTTIAPSGNAVFDAFALKAPLSSPALTNTPTAPTANPGTSTTQLATTEFVQVAVRSSPGKEASEYATTAALPAIVYNNGTAGVGATLTGVAMGALGVDSQSPTVGNRILVKNQVSTFQNGVYQVTTTGSGIAVFVLTRALDFNQQTDVLTGAATYVVGGTTLSGTTWDVNSADSPVIGTDAITFVQSAGPGSVVQGNGITITGTSIAINTAVTADLSTAQSFTNKNLTGAGNTFPTFNQNTSGTAATVTGAAQTAITSLGTLTALQVDNLNLNGNIISSTNTNGNITLTPNGTGYTILNGNVGIGTTTPGATLANGFASNANTRILELNSAAASTGFPSFYLRNSTAAIGLDITVDPVTTGAVYFDSRYASGGAGTSAFQFRTATAGTAVNAMSILGNGNVGIGTVGPGQKLVLGDGTTAGDIFAVTNSPAANSTGIYFQKAGATKGQIYIPANSNDLRIQDNTADRITLQNGGNVGIGFTAPLSKTAINGGLHVGGESDAGDNNVLVDGSVTGASFIRISGTSTQCLLADGSVLNITVQSLSGTTVAWNVTNGINAILTLSGNTTITLSNLVAGTSGNITITNPSGAAKTLTLAGYTNKISPVVYSAANMLVCSGASKIDVFSWWYDGAVLLWNGTNNYL